MPSGTTRMRRNILSPNASWYWNVSADRYRPSRATPRTLWLIPPTHACKRSHNNSGGGVRSTHARPTLAATPCTATPPPHLPLGIDDMRRFQPHIKGSPQLRRKATHGGQRPRGEQNGVAVAREVAECHSGVEAPNAQLAGVGNTATPSAAATVEHALVEYHKAEVFQVPGDTTVGSTQVMRSPTMPPHRVECSRADVLHVVAENEL